MAKVIHNSEVKTITFLDERFYFDEKTGTWQPSSTTITEYWPKGYGFTQWLKDMGSNADEILERAGREGTYLHEAIEKFLNGEEVRWTDPVKTDTDLVVEQENYPINVWMMFLRFVDFYETYKPVTIAVEQKMVSSKLGYGATIDYVCRLPDFPDEVFLFDWKSSGGIYKSHKLQVASNQRIWDEQRKEKITRIGLLHLKARTRGEDKRGKNIQGKGWKYIEIDKEDQDYYFKLFQNMQQVWKEENPNPKPKNEVYPDRVSIDSIKKKVKK